MTAVFQAVLAALLAAPIARLVALDELLAAPTACLVALAVPQGVFRAHPAREYQKDSSYQTCLHVLLRDTGKLCRSVSHFIGNGDIKAGDRMFTCSC